MRSKSDAIRAALVVQLDKAKSDARRLKKLIAAIDEGNLDKVAAEQIMELCDTSRSCAARKLVQAKHRAACVQRLMAMRLRCRKGDYELDALIDALRVDYPDLKMSRSTLYRGDCQYRSGSIMALIDRRGGDRRTGLKRARRQGR